jgi:hypothetical protein
LFSSIGIPEVGKEASRLVIEVKELEANHLGKRTMNPDKAEGAPLLHIDM